MKPPTRAPFYAAMYHGLCDTARAHGYALAIHGTVTSDLDIIACPWTDQACSAEELCAALMAHINACDYEQSLVRFGLTPEHAREIASRTENAKANTEQKPHGRVSWNLYLDNGCKVDLSVMPRVSSALKIAPSDRLKEVFRAPFTYDEHGTCIWDAATNKVLDIRGWGYLTGKGAAALGLSDVEATRLQDEIGKTVARLLNENWQ